MKKKRRIKPPRFQTISGWHIIIGWIVRDGPQRKKKRYNFLNIAKTIVREVIRHFFPKIISIIALLAIQEPIFAITIVVALIFVTVRHLKDGK